MSRPRTMPPRWPRRRVLSHLGALCAGLTGAVAHARTVSAGAPRIVCAAGAMTEMIYALGAQDLLVGTDTTSLYPEAAAATPKVGYMRALSAEGVLSLAPTLLLSTDEAGPGAVLAQIRAAGVTVDLVRTTHDWAEVLAKVRAVGRAVRREQAAADYSASLQRAWGEVQRLVRARQVAGRRQARVLFLMSPAGSPLVAGQSTAAQAVIDYAGGQNCLSGFKGYRPLTAEAVVAAAPDIVLLPTAAPGQPAIDVWSLPGLMMTPAGRRRAALPVDMLALLGFGPRLPVMVKELHEHLETLA